MMFNQDTRPVFGAPICNPSTSHKLEIIDHKPSDYFSRLPDELIERIGFHVQCPCWPPSHYILTDWDTSLSPDAQRDLGSLVRVCQRLRRILRPQLMYEVIHDFEHRGRLTLPYELRYQWLDRAPHCHALDEIRILHLRDVSNYAQPPVEMDNMLGLLSRLARSLEVLIATGFCASVFLKTLPIKPTFHLSTLTTLKLFVHTLSVEAMYEAYRACPNLHTLALNVMNFVPATEPLLSVSPKVTHLELGTRLYLDPEGLALTQILRPLLPTLSLLNIHGEFHDGLGPAFAELSLAPLTHLALCFRNSFPLALMHFRLFKLERLSIATYARPTFDFWSAPLLQQVTHLCLRSSGYPGTPKTTSQLRRLKIQSMGPPWDDKHQNCELEQIQTWCSKHGINFIDGSNESRTILTYDAYNGLYF